MDILYKYIEAKLFNNSFTHLTLEWKSTAIVLIKIVLTGKPEVFYYYNSASACYCLCYAYLGDEENHKFDSLWIR